MMMDTDMRSKERDGTAGSRRGQPLQEGDTANHIHCQESGVCWDDRAAQRRRVGPGKRRLAMHRGVQPAEACAPTPLHCRPTTWPQTP